MMEDVRDPHKWRKFWLKMADRAYSLSSRCKDLRLLCIDLGVDGGDIKELSEMTWAIYKLCRIARYRNSEINRKEIVNLYNLVIYGPKLMRPEAYKMIRSIRE